MGSAKIARPVRPSRWRVERLGLPRDISASASRTLRITGLNTQPARTPVRLGSPKSVNASTAPLRTHPHDSGPVWLAMPSPYETLIHNTSPALAGARCHLCSFTFAVSVTFAVSTFAVSDRRPRDAVQEILRQGHGHGRSEDTDKFHPAAMHCRSKSPTSSNEPRRDFRHVIQGRSWETISESAIYATGSCKALVVLSSATRINPGETASRPVSK